jgi:hypothetical protein
MGELKYTKGQWFIKDDHLQLNPDYTLYPISILCWNEEAEESDLIADICDDSDYPQANAQLIASAPLLYEALREIKKYVLDADALEPEASQVIAAKCWLALSHAEGREHEVS